MGKQRFTEVKRVTEVAQDHIFLSIGATIRTRARQSSKHSSGSQAGCLCLPFPTCDLALQGATLSSSPWTCLSLKAPLGLPRIQRTQAQGSRFCHLLSAECWANLVLHPMHTQGYCADFIILKTGLPNRGACSDAAPGHWARRRHRSHSFLFCGPRTLPSEGHKTKGSQLVGNLKLQCSAATWGPCWLWGPHSWCRLCLRE